MQCLTLRIFFGEKDEERTQHVKWISLWPFPRKVKRKVPEKENRRISAKTWENKDSEDGEERPHMRQRHGCRSLCKTAQRPRFDFGLW